MNPACPPQSAYCHFVYKTVGSLFQKQEHPLSIYYIMNVGKISNTVRDFPWL